MCASGTCMTKPPSRIISLESSLNALIDPILNGEVNIKADGELLMEVRAEGDAMEVTQCLYKGVDGKVGASEAGVAVKFKNMDGMATVGRCGAQGTSPSHKKASGMLASPSQRDTFLLPKALKDTKSAWNKKMTMTRPHTEHVKHLHRVFILELLR